MRRVPPRGGRRFVEVLVVSAVVAAAFFTFPLLVGACFVPSVDSSRRGAYWITCDPAGADARLAATAGLYIAPGEDSIKVLMHDGADFDPGLLATFAALYFVLACLTYGLGVPSGLFVPALLCGAALGRLFGQALRAGLDIATINPGTYALIGASALLAGAARITISLAVILVEATGNTQWTLPVLFTVMLARTIGNLFNEGIYDVHIGLKSIPLLKEEAPEHQLQHMRVSDVMAREPMFLEQPSTVENLAGALWRHRHGAFPVLSPDTRRLEGMLPRAGVLRALAGTGVLDMKMVDHDALTLQARTHLREIVGALSTEDAAQAVDLEPHMDTGAITIQERASLRRAYNLFRSLGLRHLPVIGSDQRLSGIVTRKDLVS